MSIIVIDNLNNEIHDDDELRKDDQHKDITYP
jgi:hypothetical protein